MTDPRITRHLEPGEHVRWEGHPAPGSVPPRRELVLPVVFLAAGVGAATGTFFPILAWFASILGFFDLALAGDATPPALQGWSTPRILMSLAFLAIGLFTARHHWNRRSSLWAYAVTDRRVMVAFGERLLRNLRLDQVSEPRVRHRGRIGDLYWRRAARDSSGERHPEGHFIGFLGQRRPDELAERLRVWIDELKASQSAQARASAREFLAAEPDEPKGVSAQEGRRRILNDRLGFSIEIPAGWEVVVARRDAKPLRLLGFTLISETWQDSEYQPYREGMEWNLLRTVGERKVGLVLYARPGPQPRGRTCENLLKGAWRKELGFEDLRSRPELTIGPYRGCSVVFRQSGGVEWLAGYSQDLQGVLAKRAVYLTDGEISLEILAYAPMDEELYQDAVDAVIESLTSTT